VSTKPGLQAWGLLGLLVAIWGSSFSLVKIAVETVPPIWVMALRLLIGSVVLLAALHFRGRRFSRSRLLWGWYLLLGITGNVAPYFLIGWGTRHITSGLAGVLMAVMPLSVIALAHLVLPDERLTLRRASGFVLGFAGVILLLGPEKLLGFRFAGPMLVGQLSVVGGAVCYAITAVAARRMPASGSLETATASTLLGAVIGTGAAAAISPVQASDIGSAALVSIVVLGVLPTAAAALVYFRLLQIAEAGFVAYCNYLIPVFALIVGAVALDEQIDAQALAGLALILSGIAISQGSVHRKHAEDMPEFTQRR